MTIPELIESLEIFQRYFEGSAPFAISAEHDEIWITATDLPISEQDIKRLRELGWQQPDWLTDEYDPGATWQHFV
jgi:hypothetical protein